MDNMPDEQSNLVSILSAFPALQLRQFDALLLRTKQRDQDPDQWPRPLHPVKFSARPGAYAVLNTNNTQVITHYV